MYLNINISDCYFPRSLANSAGARYEQYDNNTAYYKCIDGYKYDDGGSGLATCENKTISLPTCVKFGEF